jgi:hypothetical protein
MGQSRLLQTKLLKPALNLNHQAEITGYRQPALPFAHGAIALLEKDQGPELALGRLSGATMGKSLSSFDYNEVWLSSITFLRRHF